MEKNFSIIFYANNVTGLGSSNVVSNLLLSLNNSSELDNFNVVVYLPKNDFWKNSAKFNPEWIVNYSGYSRFLIFRLLGRAFDVLFKGYFLPKSDFIVVLGDFALRTHAKQILLLHNSHILNSTLQIDRFFFHRIIFNWNHKFVDKCIVQSNLIKSKLLGKFRYFTDDNCISLFMPVSKIYSTDSQLKILNKDGHFTLFYPASFYEHKNHKLIAQFLKSEYFAQHVNWKFKFTITEHEFKSLFSFSYNYESHVQLMGMMKEEDIYNEYLSSVALIFPSIEETYGLPLVEAMKLGKFIVCADLPYSRAICGKDAIYFNPFSIESLSDALFILENRVNIGYFPDWTEPLSKIPESWDNYTQWFLKNVLE